MKTRPPLALIGKWVLILLLGVAGTGVAAAAEATLNVDLDTAGHAVAPILWGIFFEDINLSTDGGLYPELVRNRSFEDAEQPESWKLAGTTGTAARLAIDSSRPLNPMNRRSLRIQLDGAATIVNAGYWGMNVVTGEDYVLKFAARAADGFGGPVRFSLRAGDKELAATEVGGLMGDWKHYSQQLKATGSDPKARLEIRLEGKGTLWLDMVSLMPTRTWKNHGLRPDLAEALAALKPAFLRFPGGCWVEGDDLAHMYNWKKTIGDVDARIPLYNIWQYHATHGIGFHEYLQLCEDLGAAPLFDINCGMSHRENVPLPLMGQWVQDALDALQYANGPTDTVWGALRARQNHPASFNLKYLEIGNENGGAAYRERWPLFVKALKALDPQVQLIANLWEGGYPKEPAPDIVDEHYYDKPEFFIQQANRYDNYDRKGPKIFVGEYAVTRNAGQGNLRGAIGEAAFMTGMERNSDVVVMASYAPLFCNSNHKRWPINLINFDSSRWFGIPSYYVQQMFAANRGDVTVPIRVDAPARPMQAPAGCVGVGTWNTAAEFKDLKVTLPDGTVAWTSDLATNAAGWKMLGNGTWSVQDHALRQTAEKEFIRAIAGDRAWTNYTFELKARKLSGREGFLILFHIGDDEDRTWWNLGGWNNTKHGVELGSPLDQKPGQIETGRWYDIKVQVEGPRVRCWLDGQLVHDVQQPSATGPSLLVSATRANNTGELILKVVNPTAAPIETAIHLNGNAPLQGHASATVLTSASPTDENTLDEPRKVAPRIERVEVKGDSWTHSFPGNSLTVLRIPVGK